jgi:lysylphosphatidylglycerol synthetase-like protein (DUF2156 family)
MNPDSPGTLEQQSDRDRIGSALERFADNPSAFLALNQGNEYFTDPDIDGFVCYRQHGRRRLQFGGPFAAAPDRAELQARFLSQTHEDRRRVIGVQLQRDDARLFAEAGCVVNQVGASYAVELTDFSLRGKRFLKLRNKISRAQRAGLEVTEVDADGYVDQIADIDARWLRSKGKHAKELAFLIGEIGGPWQKERRLFVGHLDGKPVGYISYSPVYGTRPGWLHDLTRRLPDCPPGVTEAINIHAVTRFTESGVPWLHFGFTPFTSLDDELEFPTKGKIGARLIKLIANHGEKLYPAQTQLGYKLKWHPTVVLPEYFAFDGGISPRSLWSLARVTNLL